MKKVLSTLIFLSLAAALSFAQTKVYPPSLVDPEDGDIDQMPNALLDWDAVTGVNEEVVYEVELDTDPNFSNPTTFSTKFTAVETEDLFFLTDYYWRVRAVDGPDVSDWSETWTFRTIYNTTLKIPVDGKGDQNPDVIIKWNTFTGVDFYDIQYDTIYAWQDHPVPTTEDLLDVIIVNDTNSWIVGTNGAILHYDGHMWMIVQEDLTDEDLNAVSFVDENTGFAVGTGGVIAHYMDTAWVLDESGVTNDDLFGVSAIDANNVYAVGEGGTVLFFDGTEWSEITDVTGDDLFDVHFLDASNGWAVGEGGAIFYFDGTEWADQSEGNDDFFSVNMLNTNYGWACGEGGSTFHFDGTEWMEIDNNIGNKDLFAIFFTSEDMGFVIGEEANYREYRMNEWISESIGVNKDSAEFRGLYFLNPDMGFAISAKSDKTEKGRIIEYNGNSYQSPTNKISVVARDTGDYKFSHLAFGKKYFWRIRGRHSVDTSGWSRSFSFKTITNVTLTDPENNSNNLGLGEEYSWEDITGILEYQIQIDDDPAFPEPLEFAVEEDNFIPNHLHFGINYYWRVRATHVSDTSKWSSIWNFNTINTVIQTFPPNGAVDVQQLPKLEWQPITGIDGYEVRYDTIDLSNPCCYESVSDSISHYQVLLPLGQGKTYQWQVRAFNGIDTTEWSPVWTFTTETPQGMPEELFEEQVNLYPNPNKGQLYVEYVSREETRCNVYVMDLVGQILLEKEIFFNTGNTVFPINLGDLSNGIYFIRFQKGQQEFTKKITLHR